MRQFLIAGNWKMHGSQKMASELIAAIDTQLQTLPNSREIEVLVCPPAVYLPTAQKSCQGSQIKHGAQNVNANPQGAFTGEVALPMLMEFDCEYVLLGHSERRELFAESDAQIAEKFAACIDDASTVKPVLCIGETLQQRQSGETEALLDRQLDAVLELVGIKGFSNAVIAYEPVWAIGTGETASPEQAQAAHQHIREKLARLDTAIADEVRILYGGSMKPENAPELLAQDDIDGGLIGGAALQADSFFGICQAAASILHK